MSARSYSRLKKRTARRATMLRARRTRYLERRAKQRSKTRSSAEVSW
jgi:hypothetical protein